MFNTPNLSVLTGSVEDLIIDEGNNVKCCGIILGTINFRICLSGLAD